MYLVHNRITIKREYAEAFEQRFAEREGLVDQMDGFVSFKILRQDSDDDSQSLYVVQTTWASKGHFEAWTSSDAFRSQHAQSRSLPEDAFLGRPVIETFDAIQATD
jgi:heme-degrading monooxygenase HmoA